MSKENLALARCGTCVHARRLTEEEKRTINSTPGMGNLWYNLVCTLEDCNLLVTNIDFPHTQRFPGGDDCYSLRQPKTNNPIIFFPSNL